MQRQNSKYFFMFFFKELLAKLNPATALPLVSDLANYALADNFSSTKTGSKTKFKHNIKAIKLVYELDKSGNNATKEQQDILAKYTGFGGLAQAFDSQNKNWHSEYLELKNLLSLQDYKLTKESVLSSFYTSDNIILAIYDALKQLGFTGGNILEPAMGIGNFIGLVPQDFKASFYGVEVDNITGKIAKHLYPQSNIQIKGFESTSFPDGFFDAVVTNVPFGSFKVYDEKYEKYNLFIHDYFILKSLDKLRDGGIAVFVTSKGTLDKANNTVRGLFTKRANLLGAVRLPNTAFKENAGTEVTTDILFFQAADVIQSTNINWLNIGYDANGIPINQYYIDNPHMVLGTMKKGQSMYGGDNETYCEADGRDLKVALTEAIGHLPKDIYVLPSSLVNLDLPTSNAPVSNIEIKNHCYGLIDGNIYMNINGDLVLQDIAAYKLPKLTAMIELRRLVRHILQIQIDGCSDEILAKEQNALDNLYINFVRKYGYISLKDNKTLFREDADFALLLSLENYDEISGIAKKTDIFSKRTIRKYIRPTSAGNALEALYICKNETGKVDLKIIKQLTGKSLVGLVKELDGLIFRNPNCNLSDPYDGYETASEYLSGNVKQKLALAQTIVKDNPEFQKNVDALILVQPAPLTASEISVRLGAPWISAKIYKQFIVEKFKIETRDMRDITVEFNKFTASWSVQGPSWRNFNANSVYGTNRMHGYRVFECALNLQTPSVYDTTLDENGKEKRVLNKSETIAVREKLRILQEEFKAWTFDDVERRSELIEIYNEKFNNSVLAKYDGSYLDFPQMNPNIELKPYQKDAVERIICSGNTLLHHVVGAGKTFEVATAAMKLRQLKLAQKPMIVVPNHLTYQWASEFRLLYPNTKLLIASKKDFEKQNRLRFVSRIATGDWDAVVIAMSSFERLPISQERQERKIQEDIDAIENALLEMRKDMNKRTTVKDLQRVLKNKQATLTALSSSKKDDLIKFEDLGVDYLFIDEAHKFKNKFIFTKMNNVSGISRAMSKRSTDLDMKIDYIQELHKGQKGVVFATGTPISNSMVEMYTMQSYLAKQDLKDAGLMFFDDWAAVFGETVSALELAPSGQGYRTKTRFAKFVNLPEMLKMYRKFADVKTADMLNLPVPKVNRKVVTIKPSEEILQYNEVITERAEKIASGSVRPEVDNMLKITSDGKKLALDPRCFDAGAMDNVEHKVNVCVENVFKIWSGTMANRSTQLIFCDLSTPKVRFEDYNPSTDFDVYNDVKFKLVQMGVPKNEVVFIHDASTDTAKQVLFDNVRSGKVRILIGSTEKCGAGTNVQNKLIAIHHLDTPYRPSDLEQREGRGIRQGNENSEIEILTYVTERTFDAYSYQILENKQRFISQINKGELTVREAQDIDETTFSYAEIKAITAANPLIKRKNEIELELNRLRILQGQYRTNRYSLQDNVANFLPKAIEKMQVNIANYVKDIAVRDANMNAGLNVGMVTDFSITIAGKVYTERKDAAVMLHQLANSTNTGKVIGIIYGFEIIPQCSNNLLDKYITVRANGTYKVQISDSALGSLTRLENFFKSMYVNLIAAQNALTDRQAELSAAKLELQKPFEHEKLILTLSAELGQIETELDLDKKELEAVMDDNLAR